MNNPVLAQLRDIHNPDPISFWPLAPGWYFLLLFILLALLSSIIYRSIQYRRQKSWRYCLKHLNELREQYQRNADPKEIAVQVSILLRRVCLNSFPRKTVAGLNGEEWLHFLDQTGNTEEFSKGVGRCLLTAPYQHRAQFDVNSLLDLALNWVGKNSVQSTSKAFKVSDFRSRRCWFRQEKG